MNTKEVGIPFLPVGLMFKTSNCIISFLPSCWSVSLCLFISLGFPFFQPDPLKLQPIYRMFSSVILLSAYIFHWVFCRNNFFIVHLTHNSSYFYRSSWFYSNLEERKWLFLCQLALHFRNQNHSVEMNCPKLETSGQ